MQQVDYIIVGQGIAGTWLSYFLLASNQKIIVFQPPNETSSSFIAAGVLNPVTGRRIVNSWMTETLLPFAWEHYKRIGQLCNNHRIIEDKSIVWFPHDSFQSRLFEERSAHSTYIQRTTTAWEEFFVSSQHPFTISPTYIINAPLFLSLWQKYLESKAVLCTEKFIHAHIIHYDHAIQYKDIIAKKIIFCEGSQVVQNPYWNDLPFLFNKGEGWEVDIPHLPRTHGYKMGSMIRVPYKDTTWWVGTNYQWTFNDLIPSQSFKEKIESNLTKTMKCPCRLIRGFAAIRPSSANRRPFVCLHPQYPHVGIINGLGTKGFSLAPYFAHHFVQHVLCQETLLAEVNYREKNMG